MTKIKTVSPFLIAAGVSGIACALLFAFTVRGSISPNYPLACAYGVPMAVFATLAVADARGRIGPSARWIALTALGFLFANYLFVVLLWNAFDAGTSSTDDPRQYGRVMDLVDRDEQTLFRHFPVSVPAAAEDVRFHYNPAFLQGGEVCTVAFKVPVGEFDEYLDVFLTDSVWHGSLDDDPDNDYGIFEIEYSIERMFPDGVPQDLVVYVLGVGHEDTGGWNHGYVYGYAASASTASVMYFEERW